MRAVTAVPMHAALGAILGGFVGLARFRAGRVRFLIAKGFLAVVLLHGSYDFFLIAPALLVGLDDPGTSLAPWMIAAVAVLILACAWAFRFARGERTQQARPARPWRWHKSRGDRDRGEVG